MDAVLLTWRWQNVLSIWIIAITLALLIVVGGQIARRVNGGGSNGSS
jgi:hypothetical protein